MNQDYKQWLTHLKSQIRSTQIKAAVKVNVELIGLYWQLGKEIVDKETKVLWGDKLIPQLSKDLLAVFPEMKGFSRSNLYYVKKWYLFYTQGITIVQQLVGQLQNVDVQQPVVQIPGFLISIPWGHHLQIITKCKQVDEALFYINETSVHSWSRNVLVHQMESGLFTRRGAAITNFDATLPQPQSDLAKELLKDPYKFDFLSLGEKYLEKDVENSLVEHITKFLLELGAGFSFAGRQYHLEVGGEDFYIDLLFYHYKLRCFVVIELKTGKFVPEYASKLNFYLNVVDDTLKHEADQPSIGIIICKERNKIVAEYALRGINKPIGVSEYQLTETLPAALKGKLPTIEQIEEELKDIER